MIGVQIDGSPFRLHPVTINAAMIMARFMDKPPAVIVRRKRGRVNGSIIQHLLIDITVRADPDAACGYRANGRVGEDLNPEIMEEVRWKVWDRIAGWKPAGKLTGLDGCAATSECPTTAADLEAVNDPGNLAAQ